MQGWIKLHRKIVDWEWYDDLPTFKLFIHLLIKANHEEKNWRGQKVEKGTLITSLSSLTSETGLTERQIRTALSHLEKTGEIDKQSTRRNTLIIVMNYNIYQDTSDTPPTQHRHSTDKQATTNKNDKNNKNVKNDKKSIEQTKFAKPTLDELQHFISDNNLNVDAQSFLDYYNSNGWKVGKNSMKDWKATCRNWSRRENKDKSKDNIDSTYDIDEISKKAMFNDDYEV